MGARHNRSAAGQPFGRTRLIERRRLGVQLHVSRVDTRSKHPRIVKVALTGLDEEDLEVVVQVGQPKWNQKSVMLGRGVVMTYRPATTHPQLPPPQTIMSNSSGRVLKGGFIIYSPMFDFCAMSPNKVLKSYVANTALRGLREERRNYNGDSTR